MNCRTDPKVRADGLCSHCGGERRTPKHKQKGVDFALYALDPFCSTACCKAAYGVTTNTIAPSKKHSYVDHVAEKEARAAA